MTRGKLIVGGIVGTLFLSAEGARAQVQNPSVAAFKASVDMVRIAAVVRDAKGRFVQDLNVRDFEVLDDGQTRPITDLQNDLSGVSVAVLFDVSGSMEGHLPNAREAATHVLSWLDASRDEAAIYTFDTHLDERTPFTTGLKTLPQAMTVVVPFGATSLHDAIALTARKVGEREGRRRAVVVMTDGADNASRLKPEDVSAIASAIDVPVYIVATVASPDRVVLMEAGERSTPSEGADLRDLSEWTGGHLVFASSLAESVVAASSLLDELRQQYVLAIEAASTPEWRRLEVRVKRSSASVKARSGYFGG